MKTGWAILLIVFIATAMRNNWFGIYDMWPLVFAQQPSGGGAQINLRY